MTTSLTNLRSGLITAVAAVAAACSSGGGGSPGAGGAAGIGGAAGTGGARRNGRRRRNRRDWWNLGTLRTAACQRVRRLRWLAAAAGSGPGRRARDLSGADRHQRPARRRRSPRTWTWSDGSSARISSASTRRSTTGTCSSRRRRTCSRRPGSASMRYPGGSYADLYHWEIAHRDVDARRGRRRQRHLHRARHRLRQLRRLPRKSRRPRGDHRELRHEPAGDRARACRRKRPRGSPTPTAIPPARPRSASTTPATTGRRSATGRRLRGGGQDADRRRQQLPAHQSPGPDRHQVLGDRERDLRQRLLPRQLRLGGRPARPLPARHGDRLHGAQGQPGAVADRLRHGGQAIRGGDEGGRSDDQDRRRSRRRTTSTRTGTPRCWPPPAPPSTSASCTGTGADGLTTLPSTPEIDDPRDLHARALGARDGDVRLPGRTSRSW